MFFLSLSFMVKFDKISVFKNKYWIMCLKNVFVVYELVVLWVDYYFLVFKCIMCICMWYLIL